MQFDKMHGLGNDFILIHELNIPEDSAVFWRKICDRHEGIGADLVVVYNDDDLFRLRTRFFNCDGSEAEICGNAARCLGKLVEMRTGISSCNLVSAKRSYPVTICEDGRVRVDMGEPDFSSTAVGTKDELLTNFVDHLSDYSIDATAVIAVSVGNPHLVIVLKELPSDDIIELIGDRIATHRIFAHGINVSFAQLVSDDAINLRVFERGVGLTRACASGATAAACGIRHLGLISANDISVHQAGGDLSISCGDTVSQTGSAHHVFSGVYTA